MNVTRKRAIIVIASLVAVSAILIFLFIRNRPVTIRGAVVRASDDPNKQVPIAGVDVVASDGAAEVKVKSNASGAFGLTVRRALIRRHSLVLSFQHPDYEPLEIVNPDASQLYVARLVMVAPKASNANGDDVMHISGVSVRYTTKTPTTADIGSAGKTFAVVNKANIPCKKGDAVCSPDGKWKANRATATLDAGPGNEFRNSRVSCMAGPCPFTAIAHDGFSQGGRMISVTVVNWSDTATFLLQADAVRTFPSDSVRKSFPVIFDRTMSFSVPATAQGTCIEAEVDGSPIVFPIDPDLSLSWADCETQAGAEGSKLFRCDLKPGYAFR
jgi:hypothetical protein